MLYSIKQVSEMTNLKAHVLRYYEQEGLLPGIQRTKSGVRRYCDDDLEWLSLICCLKNTGMSIQQIKAFVQLSQQGDATLLARCAMLEEHRQLVTEKIHEMQAHLEKVTCKIDHFSERYRQSLAASGSTKKHA